MTPASAFSSPLLVRGPDHLSVAVPYLVGFYPHASLVVVGLLADSQRVGLTLRVDLPADPHQPSTPAEWHQIAAVLEGSECTAAVVLVYPPDSEDPFTDHHIELPRRQCVDALTDVLCDHDIAVLDTLCVVGQRLRSYGCSDLVCCPTGGRTPNPEIVSRLTASFVADGVAPLPSRTHLEQQLEARELTDPLCQQISAERDAVILRLPAGEVRRVQGFVEDLRALAAEPHRRAGLVRLVITAEELCSTIRARDLLLREITIDSDRGLLSAAREVLSEAVRCVPGYVGAQLAAVLAICAWVSGDGAAGRIAVTRSLTLDPDCSLALLVDEVLDRGLPPATWRALVNDLTTEQILGTEQMLGTEQPPHLSPPDLSVPASPPSQHDMAVPSPVRSSPRGHMPEVLPTVGIGGLASDGQQD